MACILLHLKIKPMFGNECCQNMGVGKVFRKAHANGDELHVISLRRHHREFPCCHLNK